MRPKSITVTSGNSPYYIPVNYRGGQVNIGTVPAGAGNYDVAYTMEPIGAGADLVSSWVNVTDMAGATAAEAKEISAITCLRVTLNSGTSVKVDIAQSDV